MAEKIKRINIKEFREKGYLQELNRRFLHPLGLALEVIIVGSEEKLGGIWDYREDDEGIWYDFQNADRERMEMAVKKCNSVKKEMEKKFPKRIKKLGFDIEPIRKDV